MAGSDFVTVRRPAGAAFGVLPEDLVTEPPPGYDLSLMRSLTSDGLVTPITVCPLGDGQFAVVDGKKRLAAVRMLMRINKLAYDNLRGLARPARRAFALLRCRMARPPAS
jgi:hypothetical protein